MGGGRVVVLWHDAVPSRTMAMPVLAVAILLMPVLALSVHLTRMIPSLPLPCFFVLVVAVVLVADALPVFPPFAWPSVSKRVASLSWAWRASPHHHQHAVVVVVVVA